MPKTFAEIIQEIRDAAGETIGDESFTELSTAYQDDLSVRDAAVQERENQLTERQAEIEARDKEVLRLKAINYDLMVAAPKPGDRDDTSENDDNGETAGGIDSLFE